MEQELLNRLDSLANKLGVTIDRLWSVIVKQQMIDVFITWGSLFILGFLVFLCCKQLRRNRKREIDIVANPLPLITLIIFGCLFIIMCFMSINALGMLINPEYYALKDIARMLSPKVK